MKVRCKTNKIDNSFTQDTATRLERYISISDSELDIEIGKEYTVYGIEFWDNCPWIYICADSYDEYPKPFALDFFEITEQKLSSYWVLNSKDTYNKKVKTQLVFCEWADDDSFYEKLIDEDEACVITFEKYRKAMDIE
ncbi:MULTISPECIES: hypothetical protein [unclassified Pseudomonas]|jgi:hypothetical protein|uniref:hypothetical protein n=1 Tax=unclassified Pseudomonas TaxID=196821 RepID=UPI000CD1173D|nr:MULTISPECIES: hypothetical protein [unclassified Pseudomonas]POA26047.1 hypothetical protein C1895_07120 [Pseudomonas sp. FW305-3-2-15-E-TSA4]POA45728.1 hypothetical protein C1894_00545 [Pseudomonas sp. FW305-3-2-15-E-TSA2]